MNITVTYMGKDYTLEYSRNAVKMMEDQGFVLDELGSKPVTMIPILVYYSFHKHHQGIKRSLVDEIYANIQQKFGNDEENGFVQVLLEMYAETVNTLTGAHDVADEGNAAIWKVNKG